MTALATPDDVADIWRPLTGTESTQAQNLIDKASALLRQACPFNVDDRLALPDTDPLHLDANVVASVVAGIVKRVMVNPSSAVTTNDTIGPFSHSSSFALRGVDTSDLGGLVVRPSDIEQMYPAVEFSPGFTVRTIPRDHCLPIWSEL